MIASFKDTNLSNVKEEEKGGNEDEGGVWENGTFVILHVICSTNKLLLE